MNSIADALPKLDGLSNDDLFTLVSKDIQDKGLFSEELASRLDKLFTIKLVNLLRSPAAPKDAFTYLDELIARISRDRYAEQLDAYKARYASRWLTLRDVLVASLQIDAFNEAAKSTDSSQVTPAWEIVAELVINSGEKGVGWTDAKDAVIANGIGPKSKGGVSQMISSMRAQGWVDAIRVGAQKILLIPGKNIHLSRAWKQARSRNAAVATASMAPVHAANLTNTKLTEISRKAVSLNQGAYIDFSYNAHERHRALRIANEKVRGGIKREEKLAYVKECTENLTTFMDDEFKEIARHNFGLLDQFFADRCDVGPRISIMGSSQIGENGQRHVRSIIRDVGVDYDQATNIQENTGFEQVINSGKFYLNNNIIKTALSGRYHNPRFDYKVIKNLQSTLRTSDERNFDVTLEDWRSVWATVSDDSRSFYRSTLIVPLTLRNENLSAEFNASLSKRLSKYLCLDESQSKPAQSIFGFLCLDHPDSDYFHPEDDVNTAYVFASLLSMYLVKRTVLTTLSETYNKALNLLQERGDTSVGAVRTQAPHRVRIPPPHLDIRDIIRSNCIYSAAESLFVREQGDSSPNAAGASRGTRKKSYVDPGF